MWVYRLQTRPYYVSNVSRRKLEAPKELALQDQEAKPYVQPDNVTPNPTEPCVERSHLNDYSEKTEPWRQA